MFWFLFSYLIFCYFSLIFSFFYFSLFISLIFISFFIFFLFFFFSFSLLIFSFLFHYFFLWLSFSFLFTSLHVFFIFQWDIVFFLLFIIIYLWFSHIYWLFLSFYISLLLICMQRGDGRRATAWFFYHALFRVGANFWLAQDARVVVFFFIFVPSIIFFCCAARFIHFEALRWGARRHVAAKKVFFARCAHDANMPDASALQLPPMPFSDAEVDFPDGDATWCPRVWGVRQADIIAVAAPSRGAFRAARVRAVKIRAGRVPKAQTARRRARNGSCRAWQQLC